MYKKKEYVLERLDYIDALRGIAILAVLVAHTGLYNTVPYPLWFHKITDVSLAPRGVQLFYVVSAFTLCLTLNKRKHTERHPIRNFYLRRFFRIAPLFYLAILYYLWQQNYWNHNPNHISLLNIFTTFTFTNGLSSVWINNIVFGGWSVAIESTFYIIFPFLFQKIKTIRFALFFTLLSAILVQLFRLYLLSLPAIHNNPDLQTYTFQFFPSQFPVFLIGILFFLLTHEKITSKLKRFISLFLLGFGLLILLQVFLPFKLIAGHYLYGIFFGLLLFLLSRYPIKLLVNPTSVYLGKISFSLYLCHTACAYWLYHFGLNNYLPNNQYLNFCLRFFILLGVSSLIASILFFTIEKWGILLGKRIINIHKATP
jgi:peptidoglycan/LPS O-acetylase OafA/YrhL